MRAALLGVLAEGAGIALVGTAAWLIVRAAEGPPLGTLALAIVAVRAFALAKGPLRYAERLAGHDLALRRVARARAATYARLQREGGPVPRGDALSRLLSDVDAVQDALLRLALPAVVAAGVGAAVVVATWFVSPPAAAVQAAGLGLIASLGYALRQRDGDRLAPARADASAASIDLLVGVADLTAYGALPAALSRARERADRLAAVERRAGQRAALAGAAAAAVPGLTALVTMQVAGSAVVALVTLATLEVVVPLAASAVRHTELRGALARVARDGDRVLGRSPSPTQNVNRVTGLSITVVYPGAGECALDGVDIDLPYGSRVAIVGPSGTGKSTLLAALAGLVPLAGGTVTIDGRPPGWPAVGGVFADAHVFHTSVRHNLTLGRDGYPDERCAPPLSPPACRTGSTGWTTSWARTAPNSPAGSGSGCSWRGYSSTHRRSCCWTSRPRGSTRRWPTPCLPAHCGRPATVPSSWSPIGPPKWRSSPMS